MSPLLNVWKFFGKLRKKVLESAKTKRSNKFLKFLKIFENFPKSSEVFRKNQQTSQSAKNDLSAFFNFFKTS